MMLWWMIATSMSYLATLASFWLLSFWKITWLPGSPGPLPTALISTFGNFLMNSGPKMVFCSSCMLVSPAVTTFSTIFSPANADPARPHVSKPNPSAKTIRGTHSRRMCNLLLSAVAAQAIPVHQIRRTIRVKEREVVRTRRKTLTTP